MTEDALEKQILLNKISEDVIIYARNELFVEFRFLDIALSRLNFTPDSETSAFATGTQGISYAPYLVISIYKKAKEEVTRACLHMLLHYLFCHIFCSSVLYPELWDLACDIAVESTINEIETECIKSSRRVKQAAITEEIKKALGVKSLTAELVYHYLTDICENISSEEAASMNEVFFVDDHKAWHEFSKSQEESGQGEGDPKKAGNKDKKSDQSEEDSEKEGDPDDSDDESDSEDSDSDSSDSDSESDSSDSDNSEEENKEDSQEDEDNSPSGFESIESMQSESNRASLEKDWKELAESVQEDLTTFSKEKGNKASSMMKNLGELTREKCDYEEFLKKFSKLGEVMKVNDDEFDYIFYTYGMKMYDKMPLIEPLEYRDEKRIRDFVIAIDTSGSVYGALVKTFLNKTYNILMNEESFFRKFNVHIIQCDARIKEDIKITSREEFDHYIKDYKIRGGGGTDFRPVFRYVDELIKEKEFSDLKGLIYFTDGYGTFPSSKPPYRAAFVFIEGEESNLSVPPWAIKMILSKEEISNMK